MRNPVTPISAAMRALLMVAAATLPSGCSSDIAPITWLHEQEGGAIAQERPPMPDSDNPYPNLASVPAKPVVPDSKSRDAIAKGLVADRTNAQYTLSTDIVTPTAAVPPPPSPAPSADEAAGASLQATSTPRPVVRPIKTARAAPQTAPAGSDAPTPAASSLALMTGAEKVTQPMRNAQPAAPLETLPPLADAPPPPPNIGAVAAITTPTPPPPAPADFVPPAPPSTQTARPSPSAATANPAGAALIPVSASTNLRLGFAPADATLPGPALAAIKTFARERGVRSMVVTGFGDVVSSDAQAQAAGLTLALARARAVAAYLIAVGVPPAALRITGQAQGQGAAVRLSN